MTLSSSGPITFSQLASEYAGSSTDIKLSDYYYSGTYLKSNECTNYIKNNNQTSHPGYDLHFKNIPSSASNISMSVFRGKAYYYARQTIDYLNGYNLTISSSDRENESPKSNSENGVYYVAITNGNIEATSTEQEAITFLQGNRSTTTVYFENNHKISGKGGDGGPGNFWGSPGRRGGHAVIFQHHTIFANNGVSRGGGGGGGGGGQFHSGNLRIGGSGGGGGAGGGAGGIFGSGCTGGERGKICELGGYGYYGNHNDSNAGGAGGTAIRQGYSSFFGGNGGDWGQNGGMGYLGFTGGSGGNAIRYFSGIYYRKIGGGGTPGGEVAV